MPVRPMMGLWLLCCAALLTACETPPPRLVTQYKLERAPVPADLLRCRPRPLVGELVSQADVARLLVDLDQAGEDCRAKLEAVRGLVDEQP